MNEEVNCHYQHPASNRECHASKVDNPLPQHNNDNDDNNNDDNDDDNNDDNDDDNNDNNNDDNNDDNNDNQKSVP